MFVFPPTNHLAYGSFHCNTFFHGLNQCSSFATRFQKTSGFFMDSLYIFLYCAKLLICACFANAGVGAKRRRSSSIEVMSVFAMGRNCCSVNTLSLKKPNLGKIRI